MIIEIGINSYIDVPDADLYFDNRLYSDAWINATSDDKAKALIMATQRIDRQPWKGIKVDSSQKLAFPRIMYSEDYKGWVSESEVSQNVKDACCEEALAILEIGNSKRIKLQQQGVKSMTIDKVSETYKGNPMNLLSQEARELLKPYFIGSCVII